MQESGGVRIRTVCELCIVVLQVRIRLMDLLRPDLKSMVENEASP